MHGSGGNPQLSVGGIAEMTGRWLAIWAGSDLHWGRLDDGGAFGPNIDAGQISALLAVSNEGVHGIDKPGDLRADEIAIDVTTELDRGAYVRAVPPAAAPKVMIAAPSPSGSTRRLVIPEVPVLLHAASTHAVARLGKGCGVLAVPAAWQEGAWSQALLQPWAAAGWQIASWEACVTREADGRRAISFAGGGWARVVGGGIDRLVPSSAEIATAAVLAPIVREQIAAALAPGHGDALDDCEPGSWFTEARLRAILADALVRRLEVVEVGGAPTPIFAFPAGPPDAGHLALAHARVGVRLPHVKDSDWWSVLSQDGIAFPSDGGPALPGVQWSNTPTVILGAGNVERRLQLAFQMSGYRTVVETPPTLRMFDEAGRPLTLTRQAEAAARPRVEVSARPTVAPLPMPPPISAPITPDTKSLRGPAPSPPRDLGATLANYRAGIFRINRPHRGLRVLVDGRARGARIASPRGADGATDYLSDAPDIPQRALVRVDYEFEAEA